MKRITVALLLAGFAAGALADNATVVVGVGESCPAGFYADVPSYEWKDGHLVLTGTVCQSEHNPIGD